MTAAATLNTEASTMAKLAAYLAGLNPVPSFPAYTGPYKVGTVDVEIPVTELNAPSPAPENAAEISTVLCRVFYPAVQESSQPHITWLPTPQRQQVSAYARFMGIGNAMADFFSFLPRHLYYASIPVHKNAQLRQPETENKRWPTMIFSHGLGGSRNSYSYIAGSLASHGMVVFCPEHRDRSAVVSFIRSSEHGKYHAAKKVPYQQVSHEMTPEVYETREAQLRIRLWELGLTHEAVLAIDKGRKFTNLNSSTPSLDQFIDKLHVHEPASIVFGGHSYGATSTFQLLKSTYYADTPELRNMEKPLFTPAKDSSIRKQVTEKSVTMLLDMWCLPLLAPNSQPLFNLPLPAFADVPSAPGGSAVLAVESESFFKWNEHLQLKARLLSPEPKAKVVSSDMYSRPGGLRLAETSFFYVINSAHLSQSDFGVLFPWMTKKAFNAVEPERALRLNLRAQLQLLRTNGIPIAPTSAADLIEGYAVADKESHASADTSSLNPLKGGLDNDEAILKRSENTGVEYWKWIDIVGMGDAGEKSKGKPVSQQVEESEEQMKGELEPSEQTRPAAEPHGLGLPERQI